MFDMGGEDWALRSDGGGVGTDLAWPAVVDCVFPKYMPIYQSSLLTFTW